MKKTSLYLGTVLGSALFLSACGGDSNPNTNQNQNSANPTVQTKASIYNVASNIALFGNVSAKNITEAKLDLGSSVILLDDVTNGYAAFGGDLKIKSNLQDITALYLKDIQELLIKEGATVNILVNKTTQNTQTDVNNITLSVDFSNSAKDAAYIRNLVLAYINSNQAIKKLPISVNSTDKHLRLSLALWVLDGKAYVWGGSYTAAKYLTINQLYGDLITAAAITNAQPLKLNSAKETFRKSATDSNAVDILWSIDSSGSMRQEQANLANGANQFFTLLNKAGVDYRLGVNVQDARTCRKLRTISDNTTQFIDRNTPNAEAEWKNLAQPGIRGIGVEVGFYCVREADMSKFDRTNARNLVVFVSDEPENQTYLEKAPISGRAYPGRDFNEYKNYFLNSNTTYFSIVGTATQLRETFIDPAPNFSDPSFSCQSTSGYANGGAHFKEISRLTGGSSASICADAKDWNVMFDEIVKAATGLASSFNLKNLPVPSTIKVTLNGQPVARDTTQTNGFDVIYSTTGASLVFYGNALPKQNDSVVVQYDSIAP